jgi:hypothetical protein
MYEVLSGIKIKNKEFKIGDVINKGVIPKESFDWLLEQKIIVKIDKNYKENKLQEFAKKEEEE